MFESLRRVIFTIGYSAPGKEKVVQHVYDRNELEALRKKAPDLKESFEVGREDDPVMPNIWLPESMLPGFKDASLEFYWVPPILFCRDTNNDLL